MKYGIGLNVWVELGLEPEYVIQNYKDFPAADYRNGGEIKGVVVEAVVGF